MAKLEEDSEIILAQHTTELRNLTAGHQQIKDTLERVLDDLHQVASSVQLISSRPAFSAGELLDNILKVGALASLCVAGILYVNQAFVAVDLEKMKAATETIKARQDAAYNRIERLENVLILKGAGITSPAATP